MIAYTIILIIIAIMPIYVIGIYIYNKDKEKEPAKLLRKLFISGIISCIPSALIEHYLRSIFDTNNTENLIILLFNVMISIAFVEEICKWIFMYIYSYHNKEFNHIYDGIIYCVFVSIGFAMLENILYILLSQSITIGIMRAITAIPAHASDAIVMGYFISLAKIAETKGNEKIKRKNIIYSIIFPTLLHTLYNYCLYVGETLFIIIFVIFIVILFIHSIHIVRKAASINNNFIN